MSPHPAIASWVRAASLAIGLSSASLVFAYPRPGETSDISVHPNGSPVPNFSYVGAISSDGNSIGFQSYAPDLVPNDTNHAFDEFVRRLDTGTVTRADVASDGTEGIGELQYPNLFNSLTSMAMNQDGRYVAFISHASNLVPNDTNNDWDLFVHDTLTGATELISANSVSPSISADGRFV